MGIHKVIFDSLIEGKDFAAAVADVMPNYLERYYGSNLNTLATDPVRLVGILGDVGAAMHLVANVLEETNALDDHNANIDLEDAENTVNKIVDAWQKSALDNAGVEVSTNAESDKQDEHEGDLENVSDILKRLYSEDHTTSNIIAEPLNLSATVIESPNSLKHNYFKSADVARSRMTRAIQNDLFAATFIDLRQKTPIPVKFEKDVDKNVKAYKERLFKTLFPNDTYYVNGVTRPDLEERLKQIERSFQAMNGGKGVFVQDLIRWTYASSDPRQSQMYNAFVTLKHFDELMSIYGSGFIKVKGGTTSNFSESQETQKYIPAEKGRIRTDHSASEIVSAAQETTEIFNTFIQTSPKLNLDGVRTNSYLNPDAVHYAIAKIKTNIDRTDMSNSIKEAIVKAIEDHYSGANKMNNFDMTTLLTLFQRVYADQSSFNRLAKIPQLKNVVTNMKNIKERSLYEVYRRHFPGKYDINVQEVISSTLNKTIVMNYVEVNQEFGSKEFKQTTLQNKLNDKNFHRLKQLGSKTLVATDKLLERWEKSLGVKVSSGYVDFKIGNQVVSYDPLTGVFFDAKGNDFDFNTIETPTDIYDMNSPEIAAQYSDYANILRVAATITEEPLNSMNYDIPKIMHDNFGKSHIKDLLTISGNLAFFSGVRVNDLRDLKNMSQKEIESALNDVPGLTSKFPVTKIWNKGAGYFNLELGNHSFQALRNYADVANEYYGSNIKATTINAEGSALPTYSMRNNINSFRDTVRMLLEAENKHQAPGNNIMPLRNNIILRNPDLVQDVEIRLTIKDVNGNVIPSSKLTEVERVSFDILNDYLEQKVNPEETLRNPKFQVTNFADKGRHAAMKINANTELTLAGETRRYRDFEAEHFREAFADSQLDYYTNLWKTVRSDFNKLFQAGVLHGTYLENSTLLKTALANVKTEGQVDINQIPEVYIGDVLKQELAIYNKLFKLNESSLTSTAMDNMDVDILNNILSDLNEKTLNQAFAAASIDVMKTLTFEVDGKTKKPVINRSLSGMMRNFGSNREAFLDRIRKDFLTSLESIDFNLDYLVGKDLTESSLMKRVMDTWDTTGFVDNEYGRLKLYKGDLNGNFEMNPILEQYLWEYNMVTQDFQNMTVGSPLGHPAKLFREEGESDSSFETRMLSARSIAMFKRMVIHQATYHPYNLNQINGLPFFSRVSHIKDTEAGVFALYGVQSTVESGDGSTLQSPLTTELQNESLLDQSAGLTQKSIGGTIDERLNGAGLLKHAAHTTVNERLNNENSDSKYSYFNLLKKGHSLPFTVGNLPVKLDISRDFNGEVIDLNTLFDDVAFKDPITGDYLAVHKIEPSPNWASNNEYNFYYKDLITGQVLDPKAITVNSIWDLWTALGGKDSVSYKEGAYTGVLDLPDHLRSYVPSDRSWSAVKEFVNRVGVWYNDAEIAKILPANSSKGQIRAFKEAYNEYVPKPSSPTKNYNPEKDELSQRSVIQPLKYSFIGEYTFSSAQKVGIKNENPTDVLRRGNEAPLNSSFVSNMHKGIQLNAEHDGTEVTEATQTTSTLPFNGDTPEYANKAFKAIYIYIDNSLSTLIPDIDSLFNGTDVSNAAKMRVYNLLANEIIRGFDGKEITSTAGAIIASVRKELDNYKQELKQLVATTPTSQQYKEALVKLEDLSDAGLKLSFSDANIYGAFATTVANFFTKNGVRRKMPGDAIVISPYADFIGIRDVYDPESGETLQMTEPQYLEWKRKIIAQGGDPVTLEATEIAPGSKDLVEIFDTVVDEQGNRIKLNSPKAYYEFKANPGTFVKDNHASRDLKPTLHKWKIQGNAGFTSYFDLPLAKLSFINDEVVAAHKAVKAFDSKGTFDDSGLSPYELQQGKSKRLQLETAVENLNRLLQEQNNLISSIDAEMDFQKYSVTANVDDSGYSISYSDNDFEFSQAQKNLLKNELTQTMQEIYNKKLAPMPITSINIMDALENYQIVIDPSDPSETWSAIEDYELFLRDFPEASVYEWYNQRKPKVRVDELTTVPGEIMMSPVFGKKYGITANDNLATINEKFFLDRLNYKTLPSTRQHDFFVKAKDGEHLYVVLRGSDNFKSLNLKKAPLDSVDIRQEDGSVKSYKLDQNDKPQYEIGYKELFHANVDGKLHNYVVVNNIDELNALKIITKGNNSPYDTIVPNFQAGLNVAELAVQFMSLNKYKDSDKFMNSLLKIKEVLNTKRRLSEAKGSIGLLEQESLLSMYDQAWVDKTINSLNLRLQQTDLSNEQRIQATDKLKHVTEYAESLANMTEENPASRDLVLTQAGIFKSAEIDKNVRKWTNSLKKSQNEVENALAEMSNFLYTNILERNEKLAKEIYNSFDAHLNVSASRIPGQAKQSYMGQKIVGFVHSEHNVGFVSPFHMWITGEDFDIDKVYVTMMSTDKSGKLIGWSDKFRYDSKKHLMKSLELPIPDKNVRVRVSAAENPDVVLSDVDVANILNYEDKAELFDNYVDTMKKLETAKNIAIVGASDEDTQRALDEINTYFLKPINDNYPLQAILNVLASSITQSNNDIRNINHMMSPMTMGAADEAAKKSVKGEDFKRMSPYNPVTIAKATNNNMVGKDVIGIAATHLKAHSALTQSHVNLKGLDLYSKRTVYDFTSVGGFIKRSNPRVTVGVAGLNYTNKIDDFMDYYARTMQYFQVPEAEQDLENVRRRTIEEMKFRGDIALDLSAILSAATDNAKELILARINAGPETASVYLAGLQMGYSMESLAVLMTSPEAEAVLKIATRNTYTGHKVSLKSAVKQLEKGTLNPKDYFTFTTMSAIADQIKADTKIMEQVYSQFKDKKDKPMNRAYLDKRFKNPFVLFEAFLKTDRKINFKNPLKIEGDYSVEPVVNTPNLTDEELLMQQEQLALLSQEASEAFQESETSFEMEQDMGMNDEAFIEGSEMDQDYAPRATKKDKAINAAVAYNRYNDATRKLIPARIDNEVFEVLKELLDSREDFDMLGKLLSINQSIKVTDADLYRYFRGITNFMEDKVIEVEDEDLKEPRYAESLNDIDDFYKFINDQNFRENIIKSYNGTGINVLGVLAKNDHFFKMFSLAVITDYTKSKFSVKSRTIKAIESDFKDAFNGLPLNRNQHGMLSRFVDDVMIANFLGASDLRFTLKKGDYTTDEDALTADKTIELGSIEGRENFVDWFERTVIPDLKAGIIKDADNNTIETPNEFLKGNTFLQQLTVDSRKDRVLGKNYTFYKLPINMTGNLKEDEKILMDTLVGSFATLKNYSYGGKSLLDLLYLYNLIVNKNKSNGQSFNRLFDAVSENFNNDSVMTQFNKFQSELDWSDVILTDQQHYQSEDLAAKGLVQIVDVLPKYKENGINPKFVGKKVFNAETETSDTVLFYLDGETYTPLEPQVYGEKVINISNGGSNLRNLSIDNKHKIKMNRLNNFLEHIEIKQLDC